MPVVPDKETPMTFALPLSSRRRAFAVSAPPSVLAALAVLGLALVPPPAAAASSPASPASRLSPDPTAARRAFDTAREGTVAYEVVAHLADRVGPRPGGSPAHVAAVQYVADLLASWGFAVRQERVPVLRW